MYSHDYRKGRCTKVLADSVENSAFDGI